MFSAVKNILTALKSLLEFATTGFAAIKLFIQNITTGIAVLFNALNSMTIIVSRVPAIISVSATMAIAIVVLNYILGRDNT